MKNEEPTDPAQDPAPADDPTTAFEDAFANPTDKPEGQRPEGTQDKPKDADGDDADPSDTDDANDDQDDDAPDGDGDDPGEDADGQDKDDNPNDGDGEDDEPPADAQGTGAFDMAEFIKSLDGKKIKIGDEERLLTDVLEDIPEYTEVFGLMIGHALQKVMAQVQTASEFVRKEASNRAYEVFADKVEAEGIPEFRSINTSAKFAEWCKKTSKEDVGIKARLESGNPKLVAMVVRQYAEANGVDIGNATDGDAMRTRRNVALRSTTRGRTGTPIGATPQPASDAEAADAFEEGWTPKA